MFKKAGKGLGWTIVIGLQVVSLFILPVAAYILWADHRGMAYLAIVSMFVGLTPFIGFPLASGFIAYATTDSGMWTVVAVIAAILLGDVLPLILFSTVEDEDPAQTSFAP